MPARYDKLGLEFQYPENWTLDEEEAQATRSSVTVYSPEGAFWSVAVHPRAADPGRLAAAAVEAMREVYEQLDVEPQASLVAGHEAHGFEMSFYCLDLTNTAIVRSFHGPRGTYVVFYQSEDHEYERIQAVFEAITSSLRLTG